jgi:hypothetical protein
LGDVEALGGPAEVSFLGHGHEVAKQAHLRSVIYTEYKS